MKIADIMFKGQKLTIFTEKYASNKRLAVIVKCEDGSSYAMLSTNLISYSLPDENCFNVKSWSENIELFEAVRDAKIFVDTGLISMAGRVVSPIWRLKPYVWIVQGERLWAFASEDLAEQFRMSSAGGCQMKIHKVELVMGD